MTKAIDGAPVDADQLGELLSGQVGERWKDVSIKPGSVVVSIGCGDLVEVSIRPELTSSSEPLA